MINITHKLYPIEKQEQFPNVCVWSCSNCGSIQDIPLKIRTYNCCICNSIIDRDLNAAINIDRAGTAQINACGNAKSLDIRTMLGSIIGIDETGSHVL